MNFGEKITGWYHIHKRDLPWRKTSDPYLIWLSEIILQQTRIEQGMDYYFKFKNAFPVVHKLAMASEDQVLKLWQGLGYYTRARNLHKAAKQIVELHNGVFPNNYKDVLQLPGVGPYTAAAITSIAFGEPYPVVDGNVMRVISRIFGVETAIDSTDGNKEITTLMNKWIDKNDPGTFNQAVMEFGALYCKPANPECSACLFKEDCYAYKNKIVNELPRKNGKVKTKKRYFNYLVIISKETNETWLQKRTEKDIWQNLYEFPLLESHNTMSEKLLQKKIDQSGFNGQQVKIQKMVHDYKHILTHQHIYARFFVLWLTPHHSDAFMKAMGFKSAFTVKIQNIDQYGISRLTDRYLKENKLNEASS